MSAYASIEDVKALIPNISLSGSTVPSEAQAQTLLDGVCAELDGLLRNKGYDLPVTDDVLEERLKNIAAYGTAATIVQASPAGSDSERDFWQERYRLGIESIPGGGAEVSTDTMVGEGFSTDSDGEARTPSATRAMEW